ncbi:MAG: hypothetical protein AAFN30_14890, partial [Actinomycetota bacterium]
MTSPLPPIGVPNVRISAPTPPDDSSATRPRPDGDGSGGGFTDAVLDALSSVGRLDAAATEAGTGGRRVVGRGRGRD